MLTTLQHQKGFFCHFSCLKAEIFTTDPLPALFQNTVVKFFFKLSFEYFWPLHCATSKMLTLPFFMLESWNFHFIPLVWSFQNTVVKVVWNRLFTIFDHCATQKISTLPFLMLEIWNFPTDPLPALFQKTVVKNFFFWLFTVFDHCAI